MRGNRLGLCGILFFGSAVFTFMGTMSGQVGAFAEDPPPPPPPHHREGGHGGPEGRGHHGGMGKDGGGEDEWGERGGWGKKHGRWGRHHGPMTDEDVQALIEVLEDHRPELVERVRQVAKEDPKRMREVLGEGGHRLMRMMWLKQNRPEIYELKTEDGRLYRETGELGKQYRSADDEQERKRLHGQIIEMVGRHFEVRQEMRELRLAMFERRIAELREQIKARAESKQELVGQRVADLTGDAEKPQW